VLALALAVLVVATAAGAAWHGRGGDATAASHRDTSSPSSPKPTGSHSSGTAAGSPRRTATGLDLSAHSTTDPTSIWVVVNKTHPIQPIEFRPQLGIVRGYQVALPAVAPLSALMDAGDAAGLGLKIASAFRSYDYQVNVHAQVVDAQGSVAGDRISARPGYSEHQTGLAVDLITPANSACDLTQCFATTPAGRWLAQQSWHYGFIVRYTKGNEAVTGYEPEPWHLRYVGHPLAAQMRRSGTTTLEQVFHLHGGDYR
jgi:D-alanyl-D-alanine carboxypeptidase